MKVTAWCGWDTKRQAVPAELSTEAWDAVVAEMKKHNLKFSGFSYQEQEFCVPVLDDTWVLLLSLRTWGELMSEVLNLDNSDGLSYCAWAWDAPEAEVTPDEVLNHISELGSLIVPSVSS